MKKCKYCGTQATDDVLQCNSCGANEFIMICAYCGTEFNGVKCPVCSTMVGDKPNIRPQVQNINYPIYQPKPKKKKNFLVILILVLIGAGIIGSMSISKEGTEKSSQEAKIVKKLSDMELLTMKDHPQFYGDYNEARKFWKGYDQVKVVNAGRKMYHEDALLLVTTGDEDKDIITRVTINLSNIENKQDITLDDILQLICAYIPYDTINKYYTYEKSFHEIYKEDNKYEGYHYVMQINDAGKAANKSGEIHYKSKFAFKIMHRNGDDWIAEINLLSYQGNHERFHPDAYDVEDWDIDINKYLTVKSSS